MKPKPYLYGITLLLAIVLSACAHHQPAAVISSPSDLNNPLNSHLLLASSAPRHLVSNVNTAASDGGPDLDPAFLDDDLDFLDDEEYQAPPPLVADPLAPFNRAMFVFNDRLYFWVLKPAAQAYNAVFHEVVRSGVRNFFHNLKMPVRFANCLLQGKGEAAANELGRFMYNTTFGILGFGNPARHYPELNPPREDLGQTLGVYGIGNGFYIVWPVLGPSTLRDSVGRFGDGFGNPVQYVEPLESRIGLQVYEHFNAVSFRLGEYEALKESVFEPYIAMRDGYIQFRNRQIQE